MVDSRIERQYKKLLEAREKLAAKNAAEGRTFNMTGVPLNEPEVRASTLSETLDAMRAKGNPVTTAENVIKTTPADLIGINPEVRNKSKFFNLDQKLGNVAEELGAAGKTVNEDAGGLLRNSKGFAKILPALGIGATALGALSVANKAMAGEPGQASLEAADLATDYIPLVGQVKMAGRPSELGNSELPPEEMQARNVYNEMIRKSKEGKPVQYQATEQPLIEPEDRAKYEDMKRQFSNIMNKLNK